MHVRSRRYSAKLTNGVCVMTSRSLCGIILSAAGCPRLFGDVSGAYGSDFPVPSSSGCVLRLPDASGASRFPCEVFPYVHGVSDRTGSQGTW